MKVVWRYKLDAPGSTREIRKLILKVGFATKKEATGAEAARRIEEQTRYDTAKAAAAGIAADGPKTLGSLLREFMRQHAEEKLAPKTIERYHEQARYLAPELLAMPLADVTPLRLTTS